MFATRLRELRSEKGLTQGELAKQFSLKASTIGMYENGRRMPEIKTLLTMADFFNVTTDYLLGRTSLREQFIPSKLIRLRGHRTVEEYSNKLGITKKLLERFEKGKEIPSKCIIDYISEVEHIDPDYFFTISEKVINKESFENKALTTLNDEIRNWLHTPDCKEYIEFIYKVYKQGITQEILQRAEINIKIV